MAKYQLTNRAVKDLSNIWNYTLNNWSEKQADKYYAQIIDQVVRIANNPELGRNYLGIVKSLKGVKINRHIIFYRQLDENVVEVERILHERMDFKARLG